MLMLVWLLLLSISMTEASVILFIIDGTVADGWWRSQGLAILLAMLGPWLGICCRRWNFCRSCLMLIKLASLELLFSVFDFAAQ